MEKILKCPICEKEISKTVALFQGVCDSCIEILEEDKLRKDVEMQDVFNS